MPSCGFNLPSRRSGPQRRRAGDAQGWLFQPFPIQPKRKNGRKKKGDEETKGTRDADKYPVTVRVPFVRLRSAITRLSPATWATSATKKPRTLRTCPFGMPTTV